MLTTWILVADAGRARVFARHGRRMRLQEVADFLNLPGRMSAHDLRTDERGRFYGNGGRSMASASDAQPQVTPVERENEKFAGEVADFLHRGRIEQRYDSLFLIAAPKFLGLVRRNLKQDVSQLVAEELPNDISTYSAEQVTAFINKRSALP